MNFFKMSGACAILLLCSSSQPMRAQSNRGNDQQQNQKQSDKGNQGRREQRPPARAASSPQRSEEAARAWQQQRGWAQQGASREAHTWQQSRAQRWTNEHRTWAQRGGYGGYYIPQDRYRSSFGPGHYFRLGSRPVLYQGYPRFTYGGFSFLMVDPWPESWNENWYGSDDVYIEYSDGYYLHNRRFPQLSLAIAIVL